MAKCKQKTHSSSSKVFKKKKNGTLTYMKSGSNHKTGKLADYYEYYLYTKKEQLYVMAQIDYMPAIQQYTDYPVENDTIICLSVTQN